MDEARRGPDMLCHARQEGDDVVLHFRLDVVDPRDVEGGRFPDLLDGLRRESPRAPACASQARISICSQMENLF